MDDLKPLKILLINSFCGVKGGAAGKYQLDGILNGRTRDNPAESLFDDVGPSTRDSRLQSSAGAVRRPRMPGAYIMADRLRKKGHYVDILEYIGFWTQEELVRWAKHHKRPFDVIGVSTTFLYGPSHIASIITRFKQLFPQAVIVTGGLTPPPADVDANYSVVGYGEHALLGIIDHHFYKKHQLKFTISNKTKVIDADTFYSTHLENQDYMYEFHEHDLWHIPGETPMLELSRGCPFACKFCSYPLLGMKEDTSIGEEQLYRFLQSAYDNHGFTEFGLSDDTVNSRTETLQRLVRVVNRLSFTPRFGGYARLELMKTHPEQIQLACEAGFHYMQFGIDTLHQPTGKVIGKGMHKDHVYHTLDNIYSHFKQSGERLFVQGNLICGLPKLSLEQMESDTQELVQFSREREWFLSTITHSLFIGYDATKKAVSAFGVDLAKYGYSSMTEQEILQKIIELKPADQSLESIGARLKMWAPFMTFWKNEHTNFFDNFMFTQYLMKEYGGYGTDRPGSWAIGTWDFSNSELVTFDNPTDNLAPFYIRPRIEHNDTFKTYIKEKLLHTAVNSHLIPNTV
jgi:hypothetical protein